MGEGMCTYRRRLASVGGRYGSGNQIAPEFDVFKRGRWGCLPKEISLVAVWKEPPVLGAERNEKSVSVVTKKSSVSEREMFVSRTHQTCLAKE